MTIELGIEACEQPPIDLEAAQTPQLQPFYFENPEWLRVGRYVEVTSIETRAVEDSEVVLAIGSNGRPFSFTRRKVEMVDTLQTQRGVIVGALPRTEEEKQAAKQLRRPPAIYFQPDPEVFAADDASLNIHLPPVRIIPAQDFNNYIFTAVLRNRQ